MITLPTIHLGGTSPQRLFEVNERVVYLARQLEKALDHAEPHPRDYPGTSGRVLYAAARQEHVQRVNAVLNLQLELIQLLDHCSEYLGTATQPAPPRSLCVHGTDPDDCPDCRH